MVALDAYQSTRTPFILSLHELEMKQYCKNSGNPTPAKAPTLTCAATAVSLEQPRTRNSDLRLINKGNNNLLLNETRLIHPTDFGAFNEIEPPPSYSCENPFSKRAVLNLSMERPAIGTSYNDETSFQDYLSDSIYPQV